MKNLIPDNVSKFDNVYDVLRERGFIEQVTDEEAVRKLLQNEKIKFYIGFDPTADCLHAFDELADVDGHICTRCTHSQAQGGRCLAFAVSGIYLKITFVHMPASSGSLTTKVSK